VNDELGVKAIGCGLFNALFRSCLKGLGKTRDISGYPVPGLSYKVKPHECHVPFLGFSLRLRRKWSFGFFRNMIGMPCLHLDNHAFSECVIQ
jgi:hypothetical protein